MSHFDESRVRRENVGTNAGRFALKQQSAPELALGSIEAAQPAALDVQVVALTAARSRATLGVSMKPKLEEITAIGDIDAALAELEAEFDRRGGWRRFFQVVGPAGHVHANTSCASCSATTSFELRAELSGLDDYDLVQSVGEDACSICFPSAPRSPGRHRTDPQLTARVRRSPSILNQPVLVNPRGVAVLDQYGFPFRSEKAAERAALVGLINLIRYDNPERAPHLIRVASEVEAAIAESSDMSVDDVRELWVGRLPKGIAGAVLGEDCRAFGLTVFEAVDRFRNGQIV